MPKIDEYESKCCSAKVVIKGKNTLYFVCTKCNKACDIKLKREEQLLYDYLSEFEKLIKKKRMKKLKELYYHVMNIIDIRFWNCLCHYQYPYGKVIHAGCKKHD